MDFSQNSSLHDRLLKTRRLHARIRVIANATPASKAHKPEMPEIIKLKTEGKDDITAVDAAASTDLGAQVDASGNVGVCLLGSEISAIEAVTAVSVQSRDGGGSYPAFLLDTGTTVSGLSAAGNIVVRLPSVQDLSATDLHCILTLDFIVR